MADQRPITRINELSESTSPSDNSWFVLQNELGTEQKISPPNLAEKLVSAGVKSVASVADLPPVVIGNRVSVTGYQPGSIVGGGDLVGAQGVHDGVTTFDPNRTYPTPAEWANGSSDPAVIAWYATTGGTVDCWVRITERAGVISDISQAGFIYNDQSSAALNNAVVQSYVDNFFDLNGGYLPFGAGDCYIEGRIEIPFSVGWRIDGISKIETKLIQTLDNEPHFYFTSDLTHSWRVTNLTLSWLNQQTNTDTLAKGFYFDSSTSPADTDNFFLWTLDQVTFEKGWELFGTNEANNNLIWGISMPLVTISNTVVGRAFSAKHGGSGGQPSNIFGYLLIDCLAMTEPVIDLKTFNFNANVIELLGGGSDPALVINEGEANITQFKCEAWECGVSMAGRGIIEKINTGLNIQEIKCDFRATDVGGGSNLFLIKTSSTPNGDDFIGKINLSPAVPIVSGQPLIANTAGNLGRLRIRSIQAKVDFFLSDTAASDAASWITVDEYLNGLQSANRGDADVVLSVGDSTIQQFNTTLTAGRTITLPGPTAGPTDLFNGLKYTIVRNATTPGAFTLSIAQSGGGTLFVIPTNTNMIVEYTFRRNAWVLTNKVTL